MRRACLLLLFVSGVAFDVPARAQDDLVVPPPPTDTGPPPPSPAAPLVGGVPLDFLVAPLVDAAEADLSAGRAALALARTALVASVLPEGVPLRVRAEGLRLLAHQRMPQGAQGPAIDEVYAPMIAQAELDLRAGQPQLALPRLDFVLGRLPPGTPLIARAQQLRAHAASLLAAPAPQPVAPPIAPLPPAAVPPGNAPPQPTAQGDHRGTGEAVELYISAAAAGAITGGYIPFAASNNTATGATYILSTVAGAGVFAIGVLTLDLTMQLPSGVPPTISSSIRFGIAHGVLAMGLYFATPGDHDGTTAFTLTWSGAMAGTLVGLGVGFGLTPSVREERFVESTGYWGAALGTYIAMLTGFEDTTTSLSLTWGGLDIGLLTGIVLASIGAIPSTRRTHWIDLGFVVGSGVGALIPSLYFAYSEEPVVWPAYGVAMLLGSVSGWLLTYFLTEGMDAPEAPPVSVGLAPIDGGAALSLSGSF